MPGINYAGSQLKSSETAIQAAPLGSDSGF